MGELLGESAEPMRKHRRKTLDPSPPPSSRDVQEDDSANGLVVALARGAHPLGVKPLGNLMAAMSDRNRDPSDESSSARARGLGALSALSDELLLSTLLPHLVGSNSSSLNSSFNSVLFSQGGGGASDPGRNSSASPCSSVSVSNGTRGGTGATTVSMATLMFPARCVLSFGSCSHFLYALCSADEVWRELTLAAFGGAFRFCGGAWKWAFMWTARISADVIRMQEEGTPLADAVTLGWTLGELPGMLESTVTSPTGERKRRRPTSDDGGPVLDRTPTGASPSKITELANRYRREVMVLASGAVKCPTVFSDVLFLPWMAASSAIPRRWLSVDNVERRSAKSFSREQFIEEFESKNIPLLITDCVSEWPAYRKWTPEFLCQAYDGGRAGMLAGSVNIAFGPYLEYANGAQEERPLYLFDKKFAHKAPELLQDFDVPLYFRDDLLDLIEDDGIPRERPDFRWLIVGSKRSGAAFHIDPNASHAWNAAISGAKKWIFFPPNYPPPGIFPSDDGAEVTGPVSLTEWFLNFYDATKDLDVRPIEFVQRAGEVVFVPHGWWHAVLNLEPNTAAITQNYLSRTNLLDYLEFLKSKPESASGYLGSAAELHDRIESAMERHFPGELREMQQAKTEDTRENAWAATAAAANDDAGQNGQSPWGGFGGAFDFGEEEESSSE